MIHLSTLNLKATVDRIENELPIYLFKSFNVKRLAIDPITLYEMINDSESERRDRLFTSPSYKRNGSDGYYDIRD